MPEIPRLSLGMTGLLVCQVAGVKDDIDPFENLGDEAPAEEEAHREGPYYSDNPFGSEIELPESI